MGVAAPMAPVMAQTAETDSATEQTAPATEAANFSEAELSSFIDAAMQVQAVQQDYMTRIQETEADEDKQALVQEAQAEMTNAVKETDGMDLETYNEIGQAAQSDPDSPTILKYITISLIGMWRKLTRKDNENSITLNVP